MAESVIERLVKTNPDMEVWWDSSPLVFEPWVAKMVKAEPDSTKAELEALSAQVGIPIILGRAEHELVDREHLARHRVRIALLGHQPMMAAVKAIYDTHKALREGTPPSQLKGLASDEMMRGVSRDRSYQEWVAEFLDIRQTK